MPGNMFSPVWTSEENMKDHESNPLRTLKPKEESFQALVDQQRMTGKGPTPRLLSDGRGQETIVTPTW
jgi:hypothetical protein